MNDIPCRVSADLAILDRKQREDAANAIAFNEYDDAIMHDILGPRFGPIVQSVLEQLYTIDCTQKSFGVDKAKAFDALLHDLRKLREACIDEWKDM